ncbi:MAG TPA: M28 family peptidase, partial [Bacteroidetes bacterium]|nr:M28 family peptidase [Bacteroidota bacterium]
MLYICGMKHIRFIILLVLVFPALNIFAQARLDRFKTHIKFLADDKLRGRDTGSEGEEMAAAYIIEEFKAARLQAAGPDGQWRQPFEFVASRRAGDDCALNIAGKSLKLNTDYLVFPETGDGAFSGDAVFVGYGIQAPHIGHDDYKSAGDLKGKIVVIERGSPESDNPHSKYAEFAPLAVKIETAVKQGVAGIVFVNPNKSELDEPKLSFSRRLSRESIPILWLREGKAAALNGKVISGNLRLQIDRRTGHNVVAKMDHGAPYTIVIGAHFDHLGMGTEGSLYRGEPAVHNGADDNASGTAMLIELAHSLNDQPYKRFNYVFIAFSGEERGLLGSNYFCKNPSIDLDKVSCMINFDMVGRLDKTKNTLGINGVGTSPFWKESLAK